MALQTFLIEGVNQSSRVFDAYSQDIGKFCRARVVLKMTPQAVIVWHPVSSEPAFTLFKSRHRASGGVKSCSLANSCERGASILLTQVR
jgi:hypothetical protein